MNVPRVLRVPLLLLAAALVLVIFVYQVPVTATLDVGSGRDTPFVQGFSFRENYDGGDFRWSGDTSELRFWGVGAQDGVLRLRAAVPGQVGAVKVLANGQLIGQLKPTGGFQSFEFPITRAQVGVSGNLFITLVSPTFTAPPDTRELGIQVDTAQFAGTLPVLPAPRVLFFLPVLVALVWLIGRGWSGNARVGAGAGVVALGAGALGLLALRVETAYFVAPLVVALLLLFAGALGLVELLKRLTHALPAPPLTTRTLRLLFVVMLAAIAVRLVLATGPGYIVDTQDYVVWSYKTVTYGLGAMYASFNGLWISDQSPGLNYVLHLMGLVYRAVFSPDFLYPGVGGDPALRGLTTNPAALADPVQRTLLRLPMLFADVLTGALVFTAARKYVSERAAWWLGLAFWFNPAVLWNGAYWGQTDALHALLVLAALLLVVFPKRIGWAFFILGVAAFTKPQAMIFGPLFLLAAYRVGNVRGAVRAIAFGALGAGLVLLPVVLTGGTAGLLAYFGDTVGHHPILSANAHNLWWFLFRGNIDIADTRPVFGEAPLSFRLFSILLFGAVYAAVLVKAWRAPLEEYFALGAFAAFAFFVLPTEIHENYGYALLPLLAVAMARDRVLLAFYAVVSVTMILNYALHDPPLWARLGVSDPDNAWAGLRWLNSLANVVLFAAWGVYVFAGQSLRLNKTELQMRGVTR